MAAEQASRTSLYPGLVRPDAITKLPNLTGEQKSRFHSAVQQWWSIIESNPQDSAQHQAAMTKLRDMTKSVANIWRGHQQTAQRNGQAAPQAPGQQQAVPPQSLQQQQQSQHLQQQRQLQEQQSVADAKRAQASTATSQGMPAQGQQAQATAGQPRRLQPSKEIQSHVEGFPYIVPPQFPEGSDEANSWLATTKQNYAQLLAQYELANAQSNMLLKKVELTKTAGQPIPENVLQSYKALVHKKEMLKKQIDTFRLAQSKLKLATEAAAEKANAVVPPAQTSSPASTSAPQSATVPPTSAPSQPPTSAPVSRPSINTSQPAAPVGSAPPSAATPTVPAPQRGGEPVPLSHNAALDAVSAHHAEARASGTSQPGRGAAPPPPAEREPGTQPSQTQQQRHHTISRALPQNLMAPPAPVTAQPPRPTLAAAGAVNQPPLVKPPPFQLEGDGASHVLSKRKLDELVRQVTGGAETLSPEVEEVSVLNPAPLRPS
jgi:hypothetical protein